MTQSEREFDLMMAEALTLIGRNVHSMRMFAVLRSWEASTRANHKFLRKPGGPETALKMVNEAVESGEPLGTLLPSYLNFIAANLRRMIENGNVGDRPLSYPTEIPEKQLNSYCIHLKRYGDTVCRAVYLYRYGADFIKKSMHEHGCDVDVEVIDHYFEPMTVATMGTGMNGYTRVAAVQPTVRLVLRNGRKDR